MSAQRRSEPRDLSSSYDHPGLVRSDVDFTPSPRHEKNKKNVVQLAIQADANWPTRLQTQLISSSLGLTPVLGTADDVSDLFACVMTSLKELRRDMTKRIDRVEDRAQQVQEKLRDQLTDVESQARTDQAQWIRNTDQCLAESLALAAKESEERDIRMTRDIEQF